MIHVHQALDLLNALNDEESDGVYMYIKGIEDLLLQCAHFTISLCCVGQKVHTIIWPSYGSSNLFSSISRNIEVVSETLCANEECLT